MAKWMQPEGKGSTIVKHPGALHRALGVPEGENIPAAKLESARHSKSPTERREAALAEVFKHAHHPGHGTAHHSGSGPAHR